MDLGIIVTAVDNATGALRGVDDGIKRIGVSSQETANRLKAIQVVIAGILLEKSLELGKAFLSQSEALDSMNTRMIAWTGSAQKSQQIIDSWHEKLGAAGIGVDHLADAFIKLKAAGVADDKANQTIQNLVNGLAAVGGPDLEGRLQAASTAFQLFLSKGVASSRELRTVLTGTGLTLKDLADAANTHLSTFNEQLNSKMLSAKALLDDFNVAAKKKFGDFAQLLDNTVGGAISRFKDTWAQQVERIGGNTTLQANVVAVIQNMTKAMNDFIGSIKQEQIDAFFKILGDMVPIVEDVGVALYNVAIAVIQVADVAAKMINSLPPEAIEFGIVGYFLMGKKGALLLGLIGALTGQLKTLDSTVRGIADMYDKLPASDTGAGFSSQYQTLLDRLNKQDPNSPVINMFKAMGISAFATAGDIDKSLTPALKNLANEVGHTLGAGGPQNKPLFNFVGSPEQIKAIEDAINKLRAGMKGLGQDSATGLPGNKSIEDQVRSARTAIANALNSGTDNVLLLDAKTSGDELATTVLGLTKQTTSWKDSLSQAATALINSKLPAHEIAVDLAKIKQLQDNIDDSTQRAIEQAKALNALKEQEYAITLKIASEQIAEQERQTKLLLAKQASPLLAALGNTAGGQFAEQIAQQRAQMQQEIDGIQQKITALDTDSLHNTAHKAENDAVIAQYKELIGLRTQAINGLNVEASLETKFWGDLGATIANDVGDAINGLIQGTMTWGDVGRKIFGDMINMAIKYIEQLIEAQLYQSALGSMGGMGGGGGGLGSIFTALLPLIGLASGGVVGGGVAPFAGAGVTAFANGGITNGPTLFGMMGEAGQEAVMPLTRVGGKLGVHAAGGGGGNKYYINLNAIDTQTGIEFVGKHIQHIDAGLRQNRNLNR